MSEIYSFGEWVRRRRRALDLTRALLAEQVSKSRAPHLIEQLEIEYA